MIYLDYSANTPVSEDVLRCFCETEREFFGNPNSTHDAGKAAKERMDEITVSIAGLMGAAPEEIIYTSCASESNNTALKGIAALARSRGMHIISTALEHSSVGGCLTALQEQGFEVTYLPVDENGKIRGKVAPEEVDKKDIYASIEGTSSILTIQTDLMGTLTVIEEAPEVQQSAYGIFADLMAIIEKD